MQSARGGKPRGAGRRKTLPALAGSSQSTDYSVDADPVQPPASLPRKRSKTTELFEGGDDAEDTNQKGGHSLRKRTRIDYTFEDLHDDGTPSRVRGQLGAPTGSARGRKRKAEHDEEPEFGPPARRRATATAESKSYTEFADEHDVKDTIEVGGRGNDSDYDEHESPEARHGQANNNNNNKDDGPNSPAEPPLPERFVIEFPLPAALIKEAEAARASHITRSPEPLESPRTPQHSNAKPMAAEPSSTQVSQNQEDDAAQQLEHESATSESEPQAPKPRGRTMSPRVAFAEDVGMQSPAPAPVDPITADAARSKSAPPTTAVTQTEPVLPEPEVAAPEETVEKLPWTLRNSPPNPSA
ncbi:unnamed protein product [Parascedosporium putredinis]|uniref:Uncharacterized protein n=1 Tax=Parascedosporium putredinis TaxID=1442378 RepID=A0A9P1MEN0_9PEZI|nr:unnamed protein product [Parascedosporium putredinis]CAI8001862.1 unnamed protein product [Parascedosporium putredinis]